MHISDWHICRQILAAIVPKQARERAAFVPKQKLERSVDINSTVISEVNQNEKDRASTDLSFSLRIVRAARDKHEGLRYFHFRDAYPEVAQMPRDKIQFFKGNPKKW